MAQKDFKCHCFDQAVLNGQAVALFVRESPQGAPPVMKAAPFQSCSGSTCYRVRARKTKGLTWKEMLNSMGTGIESSSLPPFP